MDSLQKGNSSHPDGTDPDFVWEEYLEDTESSAVPHVAFTHVEHSIESSFKVGMKLEVPSSEVCRTYWIASVVMTCGELLSLRYVGYGDDRSADFWFNIKSGEYHPVGWSKANGKTLAPPKGVAEKYEDIAQLLEEELKNVESIPASLSEDLVRGFMPIDQIKTNMKLEVKEEFDPQCVWIATVKQNVGGRLRLRYDGGNASQDFWLFYLSCRLDPIGTARESNLQYSPPKALKNVRSDKEWNQILQDSLKKGEKLLFPAHVLEPRIPLEMHEFVEGMKLEAVDTRNYDRLCPATVTKVINEFYFLVTIDSIDIQNESDSVLCCHSNSSFIFPINWAEENGLELEHPKGYTASTNKFTWNEYLMFCKAVPAPQELFSMSCMNMGFESGFKLEAADPFFPNKIKASTVVNIVEPLMWLQFDSDNNDHVIISCMDSLDLFPVGWCASSSYPLQTPYAYKSKSKAIATLNLIEDNAEKPISNVSSLLPPAESHCKSWCPKIYFNYRCFTGPLLSKKKLAELPQGIGPGPLHLVINEVITRIVNIAYKSCQLLQILQMHGKPSSSMQQTVIKAKYHNKSYRATIEVIRNSEEVEDFCKKICDKLECCPYLFGPILVGEVCPSDCRSETKTKFGYNFVKKQKKVGRPPSSNTAVSKNTAGVVRKGPGRRKKRIHWTHRMNEALKRKGIKGNKTKDSSDSDEPSKMEVTERRPSREDPAEKKKMKNLPQSSIVTRGAKIPNFGMWFHVSAFHPRRGKPKIKPTRPLVGRKVGRPVGSTKKNIAAQLKSKRIAQMRSKSPDDFLYKDDSDDVEDEEVEDELEVKELDDDEPIEVTPPDSPESSSHLDSSPLDWSVDDVVQYLLKTECAPLAPLIREQEIDGQALMMLTLINVQEHLHLRPEPAERFCYLIKDIKKEFLTYFVS